MGVVTVMSTGPAGSAGEVAVISEDETTTKPDGAGTEPKLTPRAAEKLVPVMVTEVPPFRARRSG